MSAEVSFSLWWYVKIIFADPDMVHVFDGNLGVFGGGTRLAMPKILRAPDSSSLKPGSGATEGVLD